MAIRQPIISVLGHVDHGKTTFLDALRGTAIADREAGRITQHIGATEVPLVTVKQVCGKMLDMMKVELKIPGLLFIDTPGHEAFTNLRKRGGSIADMAVLIIDVNQGVQPQTKEALEILKGFKTPFVVAANKIDMIHGWREPPERQVCFSDAIKGQEEDVKKELDRKVYGLIAQLHAEGFNSERYDRIDDFTKQIVIVPVSAKTGEGLPELLMLIAGLSQKYMEKRLNYNVTGPAKGTVLEVKEVTGLGNTVDVVIYDGIIKKGDAIAIGGREGVIETKVRALLKPNPLEEIRDPKKTFKGIDEVHASAGIKISAPDLEGVLAGAPLRVISAGNEKSEIEAEMESLEIDTDKKGIILKTDALGSLEAIVKLFGDAKLPIKHASVGAVTRGDVIKAKSVKNAEKYLGVIFAFNTKILDAAEEEASDSDIKIFSTNVIYKLLEEYEEWKKEEEETEKLMMMEKFLQPAKFRILPGYVFRQNKPAIVGVEVLGGIIKPKYPLMNSGGKRTGKIKEIQDKNKSVPEAKTGNEVAVSIEGVTVGRQVNENDVLYTNMPLEQIKKLKEKGKSEYSSLLDEIEEIKIRRRANKEEVD
jgi:translation initiation factor 5B